jgi:hypothetical protein
LLGQNHFAWPNGNGYVLTLLHPTYTLECTGGVALSIFALTRIASTSVYCIEHRISLALFPSTRIYLWRKVVCFVLFFNYEIHQTCQMLQIVFLVSLESSHQSGGVHGLGSMMFKLAVQKFLNIEWFLHWKLN